MTNNPDIPTPDRTIRGKWLEPWLTTKKTGNRTTITLRLNDGTEQSITGELLDIPKMEPMFNWAKDNQSTIPVGEETVMTVRADDDTVLEVTAVTGREGWDREADKKIREDLRRRMRLRPRRR